MPYIRDYQEATSLEPTDAFVIDRIGTGTMYIEGLALESVTGRAVIYVVDGGGSVIGSGVHGALYLPFEVNLGNVSLLADQVGNVVVDIGAVPLASYTGAFAGSITASDHPTLAAAVSYYDAALTGWTKTIAAGWVLIYTVLSVTNITRLTITLGATG